MILSFDLEECQLPAIDDYFLALTVWYVLGRSDLHYSLLQLMLCHSSQSLGYFVPTANCYRWFGPSQDGRFILELYQPFLQSLDLDIVRSQFLQDLLRMPNRLEYRVFDMGSQNSSDWLWIDLRQIFEDTILKTVRHTKEVLKELGADNIQIKALEEWLIQFKNKPSVLARPEPPIAVSGGHEIS